MASVGPHAIALINLERFNIRGAELQKLRTECKEMVEDATVQGIDEKTRRRCEELWEKATEMAEELVEDDEASASIRVDKKLATAIEERTAQKLPNSGDSAKLEALDQKMKDLEGEFRHLFDIADPPPSQPAPSTAIAEAENTGLKKRIEEMEEKIGAVDTLEKKMERIALGGKMSREDKEKYRREAGLEKRVRLSQPKWDEAMEAAKKLFERQRVDSPNHISNFKVDRFISKLRAQRVESREDSTTDADEDMVD